MISSSVAQDVYYRLRRPDASEAQRLLVGRVAIAGMLVGIGFTARYILGSAYFGMPRWCFGIGPQGIGTIGMLRNFAVTLGLTPFFPPPSEAVQRLVDSIREPDGAGPALAIEAAVDH